MLALPLAHGMGHRSDPRDCGTTVRRTTGWMPCGIHPVVSDKRCDNSDYCTVTTPFMFIARCGMQT